MCFLPAVKSACGLAEVGGSGCLNAPTSVTLHPRDSKQNANKREGDSCQQDIVVACTTSQEKLRLGLFSSKVPAAIMPEGFWLLGINLWPLFQLSVLRAW